METEGSLPGWQVPATCLYPEPDQSNPCSPPQFVKIHLNSILPCMPGSYKWSPSLRTPHQNPVYTSPLPIHATCHAYLILLDLVTRIIILCEEYSCHSKQSGCSNEREESVVNQHNLLEMCWLTTLSSLSLVTHTKGMTHLKIRIFTHPNIHNLSWTSPDRKTHNQIDHILIDRRLHSSIRDVPSFRGSWVW